MAKIVICDKCKKELKFGEGFNGSLWGMDKHINIDLCDECAKDVAEYIGTTIELEEKPVPICNIKESEE